jgi:hypothetical protein
MRLVDNLRHLWFRASQRLLCGLGRHRWLPWLGHGAGESQAVLMYRRCWYCGRKEWEWEISWLKRN